MRRLLGLCSWNHPVKRSRTIWAERISRDRICCRVPCRFIPLCEIAPAEGGRLCHLPGHRICRFRRPRPGPDRAKPAKFHRRNGRRLRAVGLWLDRLDWKCGLRVVKFSGPVNRQPTSHINGSGHSIGLPRGSGKNCLSLLLCGRPCVFSYCLAHTR